MVKVYTVGKLADLAGVSVRTLHYYDEIGLLSPSSRSEAGYRLYSFEDLLRLQQILLYRELELPLGDIAAILDDPAFDLAQALASHRAAIEQRIARLNRLLGTIDKTIRNVKEDSMPLTEAELYEGLTREQAERYEREARERYDPALVAESHRRLRKMSKQEWQALKAESEEVTERLAEAMDQDPNGSEVQQLIGRHYSVMNRFYPVSPEIYRGLAQLYVENEEFEAFYEQVRPGLADFMHTAMNTFADRLGAP